MPKPYSLDLRERVVRLVGRRITSPCRSLPPNWSLLHCMTQTFIAGLRCYGLTAPFVIDAPMNRRIFDTYVETQVAPTLAKDDVVILDNLAPHKSPAAI